MPWGNAVIYIAARQHWQMINILAGALCRMGHDLVPSMVGDLSVTDLFQPIVRTPSSTYACAVHAVMPN